ncbi:hypothetical protein BGZ65_006105 [Modicella reniformis]|uniref:Uncharacterized protein n=1 Tax=Modicella reniformis TaxID=1440133 RepID=A0A9P6MLE4_9FUNG|nr:hypothetical protein BGZ65_006105 [Modicella reniformis]
MATDSYFGPRLASLPQKLTSLESGVYMRRSGGVGSSINNDHDHSTPPTPSTSKVKSDTTTPVYPESSILKANAISNAKLQLSDIRPVDTQILERIKNLEISLDQHRDSERQFKRNITSMQQDLVTAKEKHEQSTLEGRTHLDASRHKMEELNALYQENKNRIQELYETTQELYEDRAAKEAKLEDIENQYEELKRNKERILQEREETEREGVEYLQERNEELRSEQVNFRSVNQESQDEVGMQRDYGPEGLDLLKQMHQEYDDEIAKLEALVAEPENALMTEDKIAHDLIHLFRKVYVRRINSHTEDLEEELGNAEKTERQLDHEANDALEEYLSMNRLSVEAEEKASREEFRLLTASEELEKLKSTLQSLGMELEQRQHTTTAMT